MVRPSLLEQKRMQWAKEQAEMEEWAPWGRPGGGAPPVRGYRDDLKRFSNSSSASRPDSLLPPLGKQQQQPVSGRRSKLIQRVADVCEPEGDTSGYHSENNGDNSRMLERKRWIPDGYHGHYVDPYHEGQQQQQMLPQIDERFQPPRWVERNNSAMQQHEVPNICRARLNSSYPTYEMDPGKMYPSVPESGIGYQSSNYLQNFVNHHEINERATTAASAVSSFLRGQNAPVDPAVLVDREMKRRQATELQKALLEQLAEKERKKAEERQRQLEEEQREEQRLRRQLEMEKRQIEEERRKIEEKQLQEEKKVKAIHEAILGAQEQAAREKRSRKLPAERRDPSPCPPVSQRTTTTFPPIAVTATREFVHTAVQTELDVATQHCQCRKNETKYLKPNDESAGETLRSRKSRSSTRTSTLESRPMWGVNQPSRKYVTQSEKDPRCLKNRRDRNRRKQRPLADKQIHGSWPSSDTSSSSYRSGEDMYTYVSRASNKEYYEIPKSNRSRTPSTNEESFPTKQQWYVEPRTASPPVPALLKKLQNTEVDNEKNYEWEEFEKEDAEPKLTKDIANLKIKDCGTARSASPNTEMKKEDILFKLSLLRKGLEQRRSDAETMSTVSSVLN